MLMWIPLFGQPASMANPLLPLQDFLRIPICGDNSSLFINPMVLYEHNYFFIYLWRPTR